MPLSTKIVSYQYARHHSKRFYMYKSMGLFNENDLDKHLMHESYKNLHCL